MANRERGEMSVQAKDGTIYTFALGLNAQCELEERLEQSGTGGAHARYQDFLKTIDDARKIRLLFWAASRRHHPELSEAQVGAIVDDAFVGIGEIMSAVNRLIDAGMPTKEDAAAAEVTPAGRPRKAQINGRGTGGISTSKPAASV